MVRLFSKFLHYERTTDQRVENLEIPLSLVLMEEFFLLFGLLLELRGPIEENGARSRGQSL